MDVDSEETSKPQEVGDVTGKRPIVAILVGAPGSGKSTFCEHVMRSSTRSWTRVCQFDSERASDIIVEKAEEFVKKLGNARLVLVDLSHRSKILSLVKAKAARRNIDSNKFFTFVGDITKLYSQGGLQCNVIANAANW
ncbi:Transcription factor bHLH140 [Linum grandiflorum]